MALTQEQFNKLRELKSRQQTRTVAPTQQTATRTPTTPQQRGGGALEGFQQFTEGFTTGVGKSLAETGLGLGRIGRGIQRFVGGGRGLGGESVFDFGSEQNIAARKALVAEGAAESIGKFAGTAGQFLVPGTRVAKLPSTLTRAAGEAAVGGAVGGVREAGTERDVGGRALTEAAVGAAFPIAGGVARFTGRFIKGFAGTISKSGNEVIDTIIQRPRSALKALNKEQADAALDLAENISRGVKRFEKETSNTFEALKAQSSKRAVSTTAGLIDDAGDVTPSLSEGVENTLEQFGVVLDDAGEAVFTNRSALVKTSERNIVKQIINQVRELGEEATPEQINDVATGISKLRRAGDQEVNDVIDAVRRVVRTTAENADETGSLARANDYFSDRADLLKIFSKISRIKPQQGARRGGEVSRQRLRDVANSLSEFFSERKFIDRTLIEEFERSTGADILGEAAGVRLGSEAGEAGGSVVLAGLAAALPPQTVGRAAARAGQAQQVVQAINQAIPLSPGAQAAIQAIIDENLRAGGGQTTLPNQQ